MNIESSFITTFVTAIAIAVGAIIAVYSEQIDKDMMRKKLCKYELEYCSKEQILRQVK
tara:strand:- start:749 stop:922 length:174 start_codon:yes stop_codon:yes gene_type:complete